LHEEVVLLATAMVALAGSMAFAQEGPTIGVSWSNFREERWKTDEAAMVAAIEAAAAPMSRPTRRPRPPSSLPTSRT
jgi:D-xylose transport system substrate-binding protein